MRNRRGAGGKRLRVLLLGIVAIVWIWNQQWILPNTTTTTKQQQYEQTAPIALLPPQQRILPNTTIATTQQNQEQTAPPPLPPLPPLRIVFVGDSVTRYLYLSLTYYLKYGEWAPKGHPLLEKVKDTSPSHWNDWLQYTNDLLQPHETCDCYRYWEHFEWYKHCENRYYKDATHYNSITFLTKFGQYPFHGHWNPTQVFQRKGVMNITIRPYRWSYDSWADLIDEYISKLDPKPDYFVFNQGHWKQHELRSIKVLEKIQAALLRAGIVGLYRTTTFRRDEPSYEEFQKERTRKHDSKVCQYFPCLNVSWTAATPPEDYVDDIHFTAPINNQMNQQLLALLLEDMTKKTTTTEEHGITA